MERALNLFELDPSVWGVNVQPYSGSPANFAVYTALLQPHDRIMGLDLPSGGHLTHGFQTPKKKVSATSVYFESMPYVVDSSTGIVDYDDMERRAKMFMPKLLIAGGSAYTREWDYARMRQIADSIGAQLMVDMAHISGLVAGKVVANPFEYADVVTSTTHKTLRGPRSGMIFGKTDMIDNIWHFESMPYVVDSSTGIVDYDDMERRAKMFMPKLLIAGGSAYTREWDYARMRQIADSIGAQLMVDMAHISGLVAGKVVANPFEYADVVTSTTHKTLRGPRSGMIFGKTDMMDRINQAVFPMLQGGPHNHQIAALAVALKEASSPEFANYATNVIANARALGKGLVNRGYKLVTGGTDNHIILWDVKSTTGLTGSKVERVLELASITANKNSIPGDTSAINPGGVRLGSPALSTRGLGEEDFDMIAEFLHRGSELAVRVNEFALKESSNGKVLLRDFENTINSVDAFREELESLKTEVEDFASKFAMP